MTCGRSLKAISIMADDPVLSRVREALTAFSGDNIDRVELFGSRARGGARADSDYDVAVFLKTLADRALERRRLGELRFAVMEDTGQFLDIRAFPAETFRERSAFLLKVRSDGRSS